MELTTRESHRWQLLAVEIAMESMGVLNLLAGKRVLKTSIC
jgi:hypothetical protein